MGETTESAPRQRRAGMLLKGCAGAALLLLVVAAGCTLVSRHSLDQRIAKLKVEIEGMRAARGDMSRPVLFGEPTDGNAADDYDALEWTLGPRPAWTTTPPANLPADVGPIGTDVGDLTPLLRDMEELRKGKIQAVTRKANAIYAQYGGLTRYIHAGVRRKRADFGFEPERGVFGAMPNLLILREGAELTALESEKASPDDAARIAIEIVAFGRDVASSPGLICEMLSISLRKLGLRMVERALRRPMSREGYARTLQLLGRLPKADIRECLTYERVSSLASLAAMSGRPMAPHMEEIFVDHTIDDRLLSLSVVASREWTGMEEMFRVGCSPALLDLPPAEAARALAEADELLESSSYLVADKVVPSLRGAREGAADLDALQDAVRVLAAANIQRLDQGAFPLTLEALKPLLGELPRDPHREGGATLTLATVNGELRCYSWGENGKDDQGVQTGESKDVGAVTSASR